MTGGGGSLYSESMWAEAGAGDNKQQVGVGSIR